MAEIRILALDPGTAHTGFACLIGNTVAGSASIHSFGVMRTKKSDGTVRERIDTLGEELRKLSQGYRPTHLAIEDFTEQGKLVGKTYKEMSWLTEHFRMVGRELALETTVYENGYWKKVLLKASRASKRQVEHYVTHHLPGAGVLGGMPSHVWDSVAIGLCAFKLAGK